MTFQQSVREDQASGIVGEFAFDGPQRAFRYNVVSEDPANNEFGRAFTTITDDQTVQAGGNGVFAGIMVCPKQHALRGDAVGTLNPSIALPNDVGADFATMGQIFVALETSAEIGDSVVYDSEGRLSAISPSANLGAGQTQILGAQVVRCDLDESGLAIIELTHNQAVNAAEEA
jgi:hypothetical protein